MIPESPGNTHLIEVITMNRNTLLWPLLVVGVTTLLGCQASNEARQAESRKTQAKQSAGNTSYATLSLLRTIPLPADALRVKRIAISDDGAYVATVDANSVEDRLHIWSVSRGKQVYSLNPGYGLSDISWNPRKQQLAYSGASGEPMSPNTPTRGFGFVDTFTKKPRTMLNLPFDENIPFDWTPDGKRLVTDFSVFDPQTKQNKRYKVDAKTFARSGRDVAVSPQQMMAKEVVDSRTKLPLILILGTTTPDFSSLHKIGELTSKPDYDTNETAIRTQPRFFASGRLGYVWALLDPYNKPKEAEVRTCNEKGQDERSWVRLPKLQQEAEGSYSIAPVTWTRDQKTLALVDRQSVKVFRVAEGR